MNKPLSNRWLLAVSVVLIVISSWLTGCAPQGATAKSPIPTPIGAAALPSSPLPTPTRADGKPARQAPAPNPRVYVGEITEVTAAATPLRYLVRNEPDRRRIRTLFIRDTRTGQETRLGDDNGEALFGAQSDQYIIWRYNYYGQDKNPTLKTGLYAYVLGSGSQIEIARGPDVQWYPEIDGQWMIYISVQNERQPFGNLHAHSLVTGEDFLVANNVPYRGSGNDYTTIGGDKIAWVGLNLEAQKTAIHVYDLATRTARILNVPDVLSPSLLSISSDVIVWWDEFWVGYDLRQDTLFRIPTVPPEWQNLQQSSAEPVTVKDGRLYWALQVNNQVHHFTAPIIRNR